MSTNAFDATQFRQALGAFATGVTIVTTRDAAGNDIGLTANSFNSVSLNPPLVLWSLSRKARSHAAFVESEYFAVHILAATRRRFRRDLPRRVRTNSNRSRSPVAREGYRCSSRAPRGSYAGARTAMRVATMRFSWARSWRSNAFQSRR